METDFFPSLTMFLCVYSFLILCLLFRVILVLLILSTLCAPVFVCARGKHMLAVCLVKRPLYSLCVVYARMCESVFVRLVPLVQVVTSAFISLVRGSRIPLRSAPSQQRSSCRQTTQQSLTANMCTFSYTDVSLCQMFSLIKTYIDTFPTHKFISRPKQAFVLPHTAVRLTLKINMKTKVPSGKHPSFLRSFYIVDLTT